MKRQLLHTPEGVRDIYNDECEKKLILQDELLKVQKQYGYHPIQTPTFEFFDTFGREIGTTPSKDLYKFFDREGNTLVLRPDITPSIARCAAMYFGEENMPIRLCYMGNTFLNNNSYQGRLKESTQLGAELLGDSTVDADAEIIAMVIDCLKKAGLKEFQLSVGHAEFFRGLTDAAGLNEEQEEELHDLISNKNYFGVTEFAETLNLNDDLKALFGMLGNLYTGADELQTAKKYADAYPRILNAIERLEELHQVLKIYGIDKYVSVELGIVSNYQYYTGIIFQAYTYGTGDAVVKGGRYNNLLKQFGKDAPSIGFAFTVEELIMAMNRQNIDIDVDYSNTIILYDIENQGKAIKAGMKLRSEGRKIELIRKSQKKSVDDYIEYAGREHFSGLIYFEQSGDAVAYDLISRSHSKWDGNL